MRALLRDRSFRLLWVGQTLSAFGDFAIFLAVGIWAKELTGSNAAAGLTIVPFAVPALFGPALGIVADRFPRRLVMIAADVAAAAVMLGLLFVHDRGDVWILYAVSFASGTVVTIYQGARAGLLAGMLDGDALGDANGLLQSSAQAMRLGAPLAGAGLYTLLGGQAVALLNAGTFMISAVLLAAVRATDIQRRTDTLRIWHETKEGLRHIWTTRDLRRLTLGVSAVTLLIGMSEVAIYAMIEDGLHRPAAFLGIIGSVQGVGSIGAGVVAGQVLRRLGAMRAIALAALAAGVAIGLFGLAILPLVFVASVAGGIASTLFMVGYVTLMQTRTSLDLQGRVMSAVEALITVPFLVSIAVGALLITSVDFRLIYAIEAAGVATVGITFWHWAREAAPAPVTEAAAAA
ncbi:MAG: MFS transporter [Actinomycetota bacterium]